MLFTSRVTEPFGGAHVSYIFFRRHVLVRERCVEAAIEPLYGWRTDRSEEGPVLFRIFSQSQCMVPCLDGLSVQSPLYRRLLPKSTRGVGRLARLRKCGFPVRSPLLS